MKSQWSQVRLVLLSGRNKSTGFSFGAPPPHANADTSVSFTCVLTWSRILKESDTSFHFSIWLVLSDLYFDSHVFFSSPERRARCFWRAGYRKQDCHLATLCQCCISRSVHPSGVFTPDGWLIISSFTLQMSDVQAGGATVFTDIGASVLPQKVQVFFTSMLQAELLSNILIVQCFYAPAGVSSVLV